jgi:hypothetical protein
MVVKHHPNRHTPQQFEVVQVVVGKQHSGRFILRFARGVSCIGLLYPLYYFGKASVRVGKGDETDISAQQLQLT